MLRRRRRAAVDDAEPAVVDFESGAVVAGEYVEPPLPGGRIDHAVVGSELIRRPMAAVGDRGPAQQRHGDLRPETGRQPQRVSHRMRTTLRQIEVAEFGIGLAISRVSYTRSIGSVPVPVDPGATRWVATTSTTTWV